MEQYSETLPRHIVSTNLAGTSGVATYSVSNSFQQMMGPPYTLLNQHTITPNRNNMNGGNGGNTNSGNPQNMAGQKCHSPYHWIK